MVRNYKRKTEDRWSKNELLEALLAIRAKKLSVNQAAAAFGISRATLYRQFGKFVENGCKAELSQFRTCGGNPILTAVEEEILEKTIKELREQGFSVISSDVKRICFEYCDANMIPNMFNQEKRMASDDWYYGFLKRHPSVRIEKVPPVQPQLAKKKDGQGQNGGSTGGDAMVKGQSRRKDVHVASQAGSGGRHVKSSVHNAPYQKINSGGNDLLEELGVREVTMSNYAQLVGKEKGPILIPPETDVGAMKLKKPLKRLVGSGLNQGNLRRQDENSVDVEDKEQDQEEDEDDEDVGGEDVIMDMNEHEVVEECEIGGDGDDGWAEKSSSVLGGLGGGDENFDKDTAVMGGDEEMEESESSVVTGVRIELKGKTMIESQSEESDGGAGAEDDVEDKMDDDEDSERMDDAEAEDEEGENLDVEEEGDLDDDLEEEGDLDDDLEEEETGEEEEEDVEDFDEEEKTEGEGDEDGEKEAEGSEDTKELGDLDGDKKEDDGSDPDQSYPNSCDLV